MGGLVLLLVLLLGASTAYSYKIFYYSPQFGQSHVNFIGDIADKLVEAGHQVTILMPKMAPHVKTSGSKLAKVIYIPGIPEAVAHFSDINFVKNIWTMKLDILNLLKVNAEMKDVLTANCEHIINHKDIMKQLAEEKFDLAMTELFDACAMGLIEVLHIPAHIISLPTIMFEHAASIIGVPLFPSYVPCMFSPSLDEMSYLERLGNFVGTEFSKYFFNSVIDSENKLFKRLYGDDFIDLYEKVAQTSFVLTNSDPFIDFPHPITHKMVEIGGISIPAVKPLNDYWQNVMKQRAKTVLVSFGSIAQSQFMPDTMKKAFLDTFAQFPDVTFIWKYETKDLSLKDHPNVVLADWVPQNDLLNDSRLSAFVTHCGMNSILEAANRGKPVIAIPLFAEQIRNANTAKRAGFGIVVALRNLIEGEVLRDALKEILSNNNYTENAKRLANMISKRPVPVKTLLIKHIEFAAQFGQLPNLDPYGRKMPFYSYYLLDIILPALCILALLFFGLCFTCFKIISKCLKPKQKPKSE